MFICRVTARSKSISGGLGNRGAARPVCNHDLGLRNSSSSTSSANFPLTGEYKANIVRTQFGGLRLSCLVCRAETVTKRLSRGAGFPQAGQVNVRRKRKRNAVY